MRETEAFNKIVYDAEKPLLCLEVNPPRGVDVADIFQRLEGSLDGIDFLNVTDSALARMKMSAFAFASVLKQRFNIEPMVNVSCRDRNLIALQADLLGAWLTGIRSIVALTGDAVSIGDAPETKGVFEINSVGLLKLIGDLNSGRDGNGHELKGATTFFPGAVLNPNANNRAAELKRLARKKEAGARYALSQPVYGVESSVQFFTEAKAIGVPVFMGLMPLKSARSARTITSIPGIKLSDDFRTMLESKQDSDISDFSIEHCIKLAKANRAHVAGFHVVSGASPKLALRLARELVKIWR